MSITSSVGLVGVSRKNALVFGRTAFFHCAEIGAVDQRRGDAEARQPFLDHPAAGAEQRLRRDDVVAGAHQAHQRGGHRRHAGRGRARGLGAFERRHALLEHARRSGWSSANRRSPAPRR